MDSGSDPGNPHQREDDYGTNTNHGSPATREYEGTWDERGLVVSGNNPEICTAKTDLASLRLPVAGSLFSISCP